MIKQDEINAVYRQMAETADQAETRLKNLDYSGLSLVNKILPGEAVIDIGCGHNIFKKYIPNIIGIDPAYDAADYKVDLQSFATTQKFNVAFCLGSIQFGNESDIEQQISKVVGLLTPLARIYWRVRPGTDGPNSEFGKFPWTLEYQYMFAEKFGFDIRYHAWETVVDPSPDRLYLEWVRS